MKSPAFRFYPSDFWGSPDVQAMDMHEIAAYFSLICNAWLSDRPGYLADDDEKLRRWARLSREQWAESRNTLLAKFPSVEPGWRWNPRLVREAEKQAAFSESQSAKGKLGGRPRKTSGKPGLSNPKPGNTQTESPEKPSVSVSVSASGVNTKDISVPSEPHSNASRSRESEQGPKIVPFTNRRGSKSNSSPSESERVYEVYPNKVGKKAALGSIAKAIASLRSEGIENPVEYLTLRIKAWIAHLERKRKAGDFVPNYPNPATWFNQGRYDDPDNAPKPRIEYVELTEDQARKSWERDFGRASGV